MVFLLVTDDFAIVEPVVKGSIVPVWDKATPFVISRFCTSRELVIIVPLSIKLVMFVMKVTGETGVCWLVVLPFLGVT